MSHTDVWLICVGTPCGIIKYPLNTLILTSLFLGLSYGKTEKDREKIFSGINNRSTITCVTNTPYATFGQDQFSLWCPEMKHEFAVLRFDHCDKHVGARLVATLSNAAADGVLCKNRYALQS